MECRGVIYREPGCHTRTVISLLHHPIGRPSGRNGELFRRSTAEEGWAPSLWQGGTIRFGEDTVGDSVPRQKATLGETKRAYPTQNSGHHEDLVTPHPHKRIISVTKHAVKPRVHIEPGELFGYEDTQGGL